MSVIVAIKENDKIYIGCDSQATKGGTRTTLKNKNNYKVWKVIGVDNCLMASVGALRDACVIRTMDNLITEYNIYKKQICYSFVVNRIIPDIIERLQDVHYLKKSDVFECMDSSYLFAYENKLYYIGCDGSVVEVDDCVAIGSGKNEAIGSLLTSIGQDPEERIIKAIKASATSDIYVDYPIIITDTENTEFKIINEK